MTKFYLLKMKTYFNDGGGDGGTPAAVPPTVPPPPPTPPAGKTFTQVDVDRMMAEHRKGLQKENQALITQLEELRTNSNLTAQEKDALEARIGTLSQQFQSKEQLLAGEAEKWKKKYESDTKTLDEQAKNWKTRFETQIATTQLLAAADKHKAAKASQIVLMCKNNVKVVEELDNGGQPTGNYVAKMAVQKVDPKTKEPVTLEVTVDEAIAHMREDAEFANLFLVDGKPGLGGNNVGSVTPAGDIDWSKMTPDQFRKLRKEGRLK